MCAFIVLVVDPGVEICLQIRQITIELLAERHLVELLQDGLVEAFTDAVGLRRLYLSLSVIVGFPRKETGENQSFLAS